METPDDHAPSYDPRRALADVAATRESVADRLVTPWWYHPILGVLLSAIVLVYALDLSNLVKVAVAIAGAAGMGVLVGAYQRLTGLWVDMRNLGPVSRRWWLAYVAVVIVVIGVPLLTVVTGWILPTWLAIVLTVSALVATVVLGRRVDAAMRREIRAGRATSPESR